MPYKFHTFVFIFGVLLHHTGFGRDRNPGCVYNWSMRRKVITAINSASPANLEFTSQVILDIQ